MSIVERTRDWTEQEILEWSNTYQGVVEPTTSWIPEYTIDYKKKCCDNCRDFKDWFCDNGVTNGGYGESIDYSDTFYCSYHKFKV